MYSMGTVSYFVFIVCLIPWLDKKGAAISIKWANHSSEK